MIGRIDRKFVSLVTRVRAPKHRLAVLSLLGLILLAQTALVVHRIEHNAVAHDTNCALCVAASHATGPAPAIVSYEPSFVLVERRSFMIAPPALLRFDFPYQTRAPPVLHNPA